MFSKVGWVSSPMIKYLFILAFLFCGIACAQPPLERPAIQDSIPQQSPQPGVLLFVFQPGLPYIYREGLELSFTDGKDTISMEGISFYIDEGEKWPHSKPIWTPASGKLKLLFAFMSPVGDTISSGRMEIPFRSGYVWRITFTGASRNPTQFCADCLGKQSFSITDGFRQEPADSVWVYWAGSKGGAGVFER
jgi:ABC-type cobalt transport system substrate-binding protein